MSDPLVVTIRRQLPENAASVRDLLALAFNREPEVCDLEDALARRSDSTGYVAVHDGRVVGHVRLTRGWIDAEARLIEVLVLSPLSVAPDLQRRGIGRALVQRAVAEAERAGSPAVFLEGDPAYYSRLGWQPASELGVTAPSVRIPDRAFRAVRLSAWEPEMTGALVYADTFWALDVVGLRGERLARARARLG